jgi:hypothetical protein
VASALELLDHQHDLVAAARGVEFVHEFKRFHDFLTHGPPEVVAAVAELRQEADDAHDAFARLDSELVPELSEVRNDLAAVAPDLDDSGQPRPTIDGRPPMEWAYTLANFDEIATDGPDRFIIRQGADTSPSGMLLRILEAKVHEAQWYTMTGGARTESPTNRRPELDDIGRRLRNIGARHRHGAQEFKRTSESHGGVKAMLLDWAVSEMNPQPREVLSDDDEQAWMNDTFKRVMGGWHYWEDAAAGRSLNIDGRRALDVLIDELRPAARRVYEDVRLKLASAPPPVLAPRPYPARVLGRPMEPGERNTGRATLDRLLQSGESETLDFKRDIDLSDTRGVVELAKDVGAMQVRGGYLVAGVDEGTGVPNVWGLSEPHAKLLDEARIRNAMVRYLPEPLDIAVQHHEVEGKRVVLIYVGPSPDGCAVFKIDGQYPKPDGKGVTTAFREAEIFTRRGTSSVRMQQSDMQALLRRSREPTTAPALALSIEMDAEQFVHGLKTVVAAGGGIPVTIALRDLSRAAAGAIKAGEIEGLDLALDRVVDVAAVALTLGGDDAFEQAVRAFTGIYKLGFSSGAPRVDGVSGPVIWHAVLERVRALGGLAVREQKWQAVRRLALQRVRAGGRESARYSTWLLHGDVMAARAGLFVDPANPRSEKSAIAGAAERANAVASLRPDLLVDEDELLASLCQFDLLACLVSVQDAGKFSDRVFHPHFGRYYEHRVEPVVAQLLDDETMRSVIFPEPDQQLADVLRALSAAAAEAAFQLRIFAWDGFEDGPVHEFLERFPPE